MTKIFWKAKNKIKRKILRKNRSFNFSKRKNIKNLFIKQFFFLLSSNSEMPVVECILLLVSVYSAVILIKYFSTRKKNACVVFCVFLPFFSKTAYDKNIFFAVIISFSSLYLNIVCAHLVFLFLHFVLHNVISDIYFAILFFFFYSLICGRKKKRNFSRLIPFFRFLCKKEMKRNTVKN